MGTNARFAGNSLHKLVSANKSKVNFIGDKIMSEQEKVVTIVAPVTFSFRPQALDSDDFSKIEGVTYQEYETDNKGNVILDAEGNQKLITSRKKPAVRREPVVADLEYPTLAYFGIDAPYALDSSGFPVYETKEAQLLFNLVRERVESAARDTLENSATVDLSKTTWEYIASKPKRASSAVSKEDLDAFIEAFTQYLTKAEKPAKGIKFQAQLLKSRARGAETYPSTVIEKVIENITEWLSTLDSAQQSEFADTAEYLANKLNDALIGDEDLQELL